MPETTFHLIRHASYDLLGRVLAGRTPGHSLNATGRAEATRLAERLSGEGIAAVISSPLERARETAATIAAAAGVSVTIEPDLNEVDFGAWTGAAFEALHHDPEWRLFNRMRSMASVPGGETMLAVQSRAVAAILKLRQQLPGSRIAVVSHGDVIKSLLTYCLGIPLDLFRRIEISPCSRSIVRFGDAELRVDGINLPPGA